MSDHQGSAPNDAHLSVARKERSVLRGKRLHNDRPGIPAASSMPGLDAAPSGLPPVSDAGVVRVACSKCHLGQSRRYLHAIPFSIENGFQKGQRNLFLQSAKQITPLIIVALGLCGSHGLVIRQLNMVKRQNPGGRDDRIEMGRPAKDLFC